MTKNRAYELFVGLRYIRSRSDNRFISFISLTSILGIVIGVAVLIVVLSVMNGFESELRTRILNMTAHASITGDENGLVDWQEQLGIAMSDPDVVAAAPFIEGQGMMVAGDELSGTAIRGIDPDEENNVSGIANLLRSGSLSQLVSGEFKIVLGRDLAEALDVGVGDKVVLVISRGMVTPAGIVPRMRRFEVIGLFSAGMYEYDRNMAFIHIEDAARLYQLRDRVSGVRLRLNDMFLAPSVVRSVAMKMGGGVYISDWTRKHSNFFRSIQITKSMMFVILLLVVGVAAFNIVSTLVMVVRDKQGDIAILRTVGSAPRSIMAVFMIQGTVIGFIGTLAGLALGVLLAINVESLVHGLEALLGIQFLAPDVYYITDLPAEIRIADLIRICSTALVLALVSTIYPAWRAARIQPAEVLRYE